MKKVIFISSVLLSVVFVGCHDHEDTETLKEAKRIHEEMIKVQANLENVMQVKGEELKNSMQNALAKGDTMLAENLHKVTNQLHDVTAKLEHWEQNLVEIPGHVHVHADGEVCNHDANDPSLEGMTDADILEIQNELKLQLEKIQAQLKAIEKN